ncbi:hypothetical protein [Paraburkholderia sp.]|uniref:hypothetical protein n=1 Tax=Paraburkholderia sp. TaxID=1926495 RepID=UPI0023934C72|nr:hypothetical protein [Paraburkholderia sp.]MDE1183856.1 hypothetical protein [Paraburkholderia sp.]
MSTQYTVTFTFARLRAARHSRLARLLTLPAAAVALCGSLAGCYYPYGYYPYGYSGYYQTVPVGAAQTEVPVGSTNPPPPAPSQAAPPTYAVAQPPVYVAPPPPVYYPAYYPAYYPSYPAYYGWGGPAISFSFGGYWGGGRGWHGGGYGHRH